MVQWSKAPFLIYKYHTIFLAKWGKPWNFPKICLHTWVNFKFVLNCAKTLNRVFGVIECWCKGQKCQICFNEKELCLWESETSLETFENLSSHNGVICKLILKCVKSLIESSDCLNIATRRQSGKSGRWIQNYFSEKMRQTLNLSKKVSFYIGVKYNLIWTLPKSKLSLLRYWICLQGSHYQLWWKKTKPFFWEKEAKFETF